MHDNHTCVPHVVGAGSLAQHASALHVPESDPMAVQLRVKASVEPCAQTIPAAYTPHCVATGLGGVAQHLDGRQSPTSLAETPGWHGTDEFSCVPGRHASCVTNTPHVEGGGGGTQHLAWVQVPAGEAMPCWHAMLMSSPVPLAQAIAAMLAL
jgi:hypothetical protein